MTKAKQKAKGAMRSATIQINAVLLAIAASLPELVPYLAENAPLLKPYQGPEIYQHMMVVVTIINIVLRFRTSTALEAK